MFDELILLAAVVLAATFVRSTRRLESGQRGYMLLIAGVLGMAVAALLRSSRYLGVVSIALTILLVVVPWTSEVLARWAFGRGRLRVAVWLAALRATLMPGAGLGRQQVILRGLALLEGKGVDEALTYFRGLADESEDDAELQLINEQIVSMLLYGQRWDEGIAHYEARFEPHYAALRPALALGLLRAYGESGRMQNAAGLLRALEEGPLGSDPRSLGVVSQARLTFLAYAGAARTVEEALDDQGRRLLGVSPASGALYRGIAHLRAGQPEPALHELARVEELAERSDDRTVEASRHAMKTLEGYEEAAEGAEAVDIGPDLRSYAQEVARRLQRFLQAAPRLRRPGARIATPVLLIGVAAGYLVVQALDLGGTGLLVAGGATAELLRQGGPHWARFLTGLWVHASPLTTLLHLYALWLSAPLFERVYGTGRLVLVALGGGMAGLLASAATTDAPALVLSGANAMTTAVVAGTVWTLLPFRSPAFPSRARRSILVPLGLVLVALGLAAVPGVGGLHVSVWAVLVAAGTGLFFAMIPSGGLGRHVRWLAAPLSIALAVAIGMVAVQPIPAVGQAPVALPTVDAGRVALPAVFGPVKEREERVGVPLPLQPGAVDRVAMQAGEVVQVIHSSESITDAPMLLQIDPSLAHELTVVADLELPSALREALEERGVSPQTLEVFALRRDGEEIARLVQWQGARPGGTWALLSMPPEALAHAASTYAEVVADHTP